MKKLSGLAGAVLLALLGLTSPGKSQQVVRQGTTPWVVGGTVNLGGTLPAFASTPSFICVSGCTPAAPFSDQTAFVAGTTLFTLSGGFFQTTATANPLANLQSGATQMTANRALHINLRNAAATEVGTAAAPLRVDPTGTTTQPVSGAVSLTGTLPGFASTPTFNCGTGCSGGGGSSGIADETAFVAGTTLQMPVGGFFQTTATSNPLTNGQSGATQLTINRAFHINLRNASGVELGVAAAPVRTDPTGTTIQPISAASMPLPGGASTAAKQAQFTAAGSPSATDVYTVQGCATCTAANIVITGSLPAYASTPAFTISGLLPAFASPPSVTITGTLPAFASTPAVTISGTPAVTISGSLPAYAATPTFNLGTLNGAATAAKQPALGTAGAASADVITVQGIASGTPQNVSAASLPLPTGASTAAKQPAIGTAGAPATDVITVQGISSGTPQPVSATSLPLPAGAATDASLTTVNTNLGVPAATACATDNGTCDHNALLKRIAQRLSTLIATGGTAFSIVDSAAWTAGTSPFVPAGGEFNASATALTTGQQGTIALSANRHQLTLEDNSAAILSAMTSSIPTGTNNIGTVNGSTVSLSAAIPTGTNNIGTVTGSNVGGYDANPATTPTVQASAYASGNCMGGFQTVALARTSGGAGIINKFTLVSTGGATAALQVFIFDSNPSGSTCTDKGAFTIAVADQSKLLTTFSLTPAAPTGVTWTEAEQSNIGAPFATSGNANVYVAIVAGAAVTPASTTDLKFRVGASLD